MLRSKLRPLVEPVVFLVALAIFMGVYFFIANQAKADTISGYGQSRSTIVIQNMTPSHSMSPWLNSQVDYYRHIGWTNGSDPISLVQGSCQPNMPCVRVWIDNFGAGYSGLTTFASQCIYNSRLSACRYGSGAPRDYTRVNINTYYALTYYQYRNIMCHELGHAWGLAHYGSQASCMYYMVQSPGRFNITLDEVVNDLNVTYRGVAL